METIDFYATEPHFADHLAPTWHALPPEARGRFVIHPRIAHRFARHGIPFEHEVRPLGLTVVAGYGDLRKARTVTDRIIYTEHGTGQSYISARETGSYIGAGDRDGVAAIFVPGPHAHTRAVAAYPGIPVYEVGCPKLDRWASFEKAKPEHPSAATVAVSFHWDAIAVAPEARSAWGQFGTAAVKLRDRFHRVIGHGHPKAMGRYAPVYARGGLDVAWSFDDVIAQADVYVIDNSSTLFEWVALDRPVVVMNPRWYRRDVHHGLRFWEYADVGVQVDHPADLAGAVVDALNDTPERAARRAEVTAALYRPGPAAPTAAAALVEVASGRVGAA
jgi:hypothetical protein